MIKNVEGLLEKVTANIREQMDVAVIGLSGGADSTLVAILCKQALGGENVYGIHLPYGEIDDTNFNVKSVAVAHKLGIWDRTLRINQAVDALTDQFEPLSELNQGNMRSRMRMVALYTICCALSENLSGQRVRVLGTGNLSEDFIGYDTKGGDALADYFPIGELVKSEVYQLLEYFRDQGVISEEMINRTPSAGLWDGQTDEDELGFTYNSMEQYVLFGFKWGVENFFGFEDPVATFVGDRHKTNKHKHEAPPVASLREFCEDE